ncbi:MAG: MBL fold metallo-hydrolase [Actinomycetota bacterium]
MNITYEGDVIAIDTFMHGVEGITAVYYLPGSVPTLIETGPATSFERVVEYLDSVGAKIELIVVTHIHLDHAGAVGHFARKYPDARVVVRQEGAPHLIDPSRLWASASRIYHGMEKLWGEMLPVDASRVTAIDTDGPIAKIGEGRILEAHYAPGHAKHHMALLETSRGDLFTGDAIGVYLPEAGVIRPAIPPPEFDLEVSIDTVDALAAIGSTRTFPTHYGEVPDQQAAFEEAKMRFNQWVEFAEPYFEKGADTAALAQAYRSAREDFYPGLSIEMIERFEQTTSYEMNAGGVLRYLKQRSEQES